MITNLNINWSSLGNDLCSLRKKAWGQGTADNRSHTMHQLREHALVGGDLHGTASFLVQKDHREETRRQLKWRFCSNMLSLFSDHRSTLLLANGFVWEASCFWAQPSTPAGPATPPVSQIPTAERLANAGSKGLKSVARKPAGWFRTYLVWCCSSHLN